MSDDFVFYPSQRLGLAFHFAAILILVAATGAGIWSAARADVGLVFLLSLLPAVLAVGFVPVLVYRAYSLRNASYTLERDGIRLRWGWRAVDIPMNAVLWVHPASELTFPVSLPRLRWPGSIRGEGSLPRAAEVEFMASEASRLVLIATAERTFAISPANPQAFIDTFQRFTEIGSLQPIEARSVFPIILLGRVWSSRPARFLLLAGAGLSLLLFIWVYLSTGAIDQAPMGFLPDGSPGEPGPAVRLLLLPVLNGLFFLSDAVLGLFFFRAEERQSLAFLVWGTGSFTALLFLLAVFFILRVA